MANSDIDICNRALIKLGEPVISSFEEETNRAEICQTAYPDFSRAMLDIYDWQFTAAQRELAKVTSADPIGWESAFNLPSDRLDAPEAVYIDTRGTLLKDFEIVGEQIFCDFDQIFIRYHLAVTEAKWPPIFQEFVSTAFAAEICMAITEKDSLYDKQIKAAWGDERSRTGGLFQRAKNKDTRNSPVRSLIEDGGPILRGRLEGARSGSGIRVI